MYIILSYIHSR